MYSQQKQFIENASHELQTPLAICRNKLELLAERPDCTEGQLEEIEDIHRNLGRIVKLNNPYCSFPVSKMANSTKRKKWNSTQS